jgi:hypothetical protein
VNGADLRAHLLGRPKPHGFPAGHVVVNRILGGEQSAGFSQLIASWTDEQVSRGLTGGGDGLDGGRAQWAMSRTTCR